MKKFTLTLKIRAEAREMMDIEIFKRAERAAISAVR